MAVHRAGCEVVLAGYLSEERLRLIGATERLTIAFHLGSTFATHLTKSKYIHTLSLIPLICFKYSGYVHSLSPKLHYFIFQTAIDRGIGAQGNHMMLCKSPKAFEKIITIS